MIRPIQITDDLNDVTKLIYQTDIFLFHLLFGRKDKAIAKLKRLLRMEHNSFSYRNIIACIENGTIKGMLIGIDPKSIDTKKENKDYVKAFTIPELIILGVKYSILGRILSTKGLKGLYIQNISVSENCRGEGIGSRLIDFYTDLALKSKVELLWLDVSTSNERAKKLYESKGFQVAEIRKLPFIKEGAYRMKKRLKL